MPPYGGFFFSLNSLGAAAHCRALSGLLSQVLSALKGRGLFARISPALFNAVFCGRSIGAA